MDECSNADCSNVMYRRGLCRKHYKTWLDLNPEKRYSRTGKWTNPDGSRVQCSQPECVRPVFVKGVCQYHYHHLDYLANSEGIVKRRNRKLNGVMPECSVEGCHLSESSRGFCGTHYYHVVRGRPPELSGATVECLVDGCLEEITLRATSSGLCRRHAGFRNKFGLTVDAVIELYDELICRNPGCNSTERLSLDHDHSCCNGQRSCGKCVRGWLCNTCNSALGLLGEDRNRISGLIDYLDSL